jgi:hypothetical protein
LPVASTAIEFGESNLALAPPPSKKPLVPPATVETVTGCGESGFSTLNGACFLLQLQMNKENAIIIKWDDRVMVTSGFIEV